MNTPPGRHSFTATAAEFLGSARLTRAITLSTLAIAFLAFALRSTMGWPGLIGACRPSSSSPRSPSR